MHWLKQAICHPSPNFDERPDPLDVTLIVIHNISLPPGQYGGNGIDQLFLNQLNPNEHPYYKQIHQLKVSAHLLIRRTGELIQYVALDKRAWHAGKSEFSGRERCNDFAIGIELEGCDNEPYTEEQYKQLLTTTRDIQKLYPQISKQRITGHCDISPGRKTDPGESFDWDYYFNALRKL